MGRIKIMIEFLRFNRIKTYIFCCATYFLLGSVVLYLYPKGELELLVNAKYMPVLDVFFKYWTHIGDGLFFTGVIIAMLFVSYYFCIVGTCIGLLHSAVIQYLKLKVFDQSQRPFKFFKDVPDLNIHLVDGVEIYDYNSFPSGHTSTAFAMITFIVLMLLIRFGKANPVIQFTLFTIALLVGFSRIYLFQHFFIDTYFGSMIGIVCAFVVVYLFELTALKAKIGNRSIFHPKA